MAEVSLAVQQFTAPGTYITQDFAGALPAGIVSFSNAYLFGEVSDLVSTSLTTGIPYNVPIQITSLEDFETRLGNGNQNAFVTPAFGAALDTYNSVKLFFRNAASGVAASLFFIRVKPVGGATIQVGNPESFTLTDNVGIQQTLFGYPIEINGFRIGRVDFDSLGNSTHVGVQVSNASAVAESTLAVLDAIVNNAPVSASVYARLQPGTVDVIELFPRTVDGGLSINGIDVTTITGPVAEASYSYDRLLASDDPSSSRPRVEARDYVYAIENSLDPTVYRPGFVIAPAAFAKFNPEDRLRVGTALENKVSSIDYSWMTLVDCGPADGTGIQLHYDLERFDLADQSNLTGLEQPFFIRETQEFYVPNQAADFSEGSAGVGVAAKDMDLPRNFTALTAVVVGTELETGDVIEAEDAGTTYLYVVQENFTPTVAPIDIADPVGDGSNDTDLLDRAKLIVELEENTPIVSPVAGQQVDSGSYVEVIGPGGLPQLTNALVVSDFTPTAVPIDPADPVGDGSNQTGLLDTNDVASTADKVFAAGQLIDEDGILYYVRGSVQQDGNGIPSISLTNGDLDRTIPLAYYQEWVRVNLIDGSMNLATFNPADPSVASLGARNVLWNSANHDALAREHLMYTSAFGYLAFYGPYVVDLEGFNVPASASVAGTALRRYREQGFQEPPAGTIYPLRGVLRPQINITRAHQQSSNPTGMNAIRLLPNQGTVIFGARTRSSNPLFRWVNTRVILNVVINSLRGAFDDKIFRAIDGGQNLFRQIRGTADGILYLLWQGQALYGASPAEAYRVIVNNSNNPDFNLENGAVNVDVYVVPVSTLEVISIRVVRTAIGQLSLTVSSGGGLTG